MYISYSFLFDYIVYIIFYYLNSYSIIRRCSILLRTQLTYTTYIWISCLHLPAKHWSSKCSNKLAMAGHNSKIAMAENPTVSGGVNFWGPGATSNLCRHGIWHKDSPTQWLGSRFPFLNKPHLLLGAGQVTCCKKHQWLHSIQHQTPGVRDSRLDRGRSSHLGRPLVDPCPKEIEHHRVQLGTMNNPSSYGCVWNLSF